MYIQRGEVTIVNSHFADNTAPQGNDIWTVPSLIIINSTFSNSNNSIVGTPHLCTPKICQDAIPSYPNYGIDCKKDVYKNDNYGLQCFPCHPGKYLAENDSSYASCLPCLAGRATKKYGSASYDICSPGKYQPKNAIATLCKLCEPGKYSNNSIKCLNIPPGNHPSKCIIKNATKRGCNSFAPCPRGFVTTQAGQSKCERCSPGMTTFIEGSIKCSSCPKGTAGTNGTCTPCTGLTHASNVNSTTCEHCSDIYMVPDNSHIDCVKQEGIGHGPIIYNIYANANGDKHNDSSLSSIDFLFFFFSIQKLLYPRNDL